MKILFVCSTGGHLGQLYKLRPWWEAHERAWVTFDDPHSPLAAPRRARHAGLRPDPHATCPTPSGTCAWLSDSPRLSSRCRHLRRRRGGVPFFLVARVIGIRTAYLEVFDRITRPTMTGRLCYPIAELSCSSGRSRCGISARAGDRMPAVTARLEAQRRVGWTGRRPDVVITGTDHHPFDRLIS